VYGDGAAWWSAGQKYVLKYLGIIESDVTRVEGQQNLPEANRAAIRSCMDRNRDLIV
jgi:hypothetical protein